MVHDLEKYSHNYLGVYLSEKSDLASHLEKVYEKAFIEKVYFKKSGAPLTLEV